MRILNTNLIPMREKQSMNVRAQWLFKRTTLLECLGQVLRKTEKLVI